MVFPVQRFETKDDQDTHCAVPQRLVCNKSRTSYAVPSSLPHDLFQRSNSLPKSTLSKQHVFGLCAQTLYSGAPLHCLPPFRGECNHVVIYPAASLGVVHDLTSNVQSYFEGHSNDITCLSIDRSGRYVVSGQLGKHCIFRGFQRS